MGQHNLHMDRRGDNVRDEKICDPHLPRWQGCEHREEIGPEKGDTGELKVEQSMSWGFEKERRVRVGVQVETGEGEHNVVEFVSLRQQSIRIRQRTNRTTDWIPINVRAKTSSAMTRL